MIKHLPGATITRKIVADEPDEIIRAFDEGNTADFILTTGGTGIGPRDITPETTLGYCDKLVPGIAETLRAESYKQTPHAMISRGVAGMKEHSLIVNFPGSVRGAVFCTQILLPVMLHIVKMRDGKGH